MNIITPIAITDAMVGAGTIPAAEDATPVWNPATNYTVGTEVHRVQTHRVYKCAIAGVSATPPENETGTKWTDMRPTNRWAPFDQYTSTQTTGTTQLKYVVSPGFFNAAVAYGLIGTSYDFTVREAPLGAVIYQRSGLLVADPIGWYEYLFTTPAPIEKLLFTDIPLRPGAEATLTLDTGAGQPVKLGMLVFGDYTPLIGADAPWGGTQWGATAEPVTYSYIKFNEDDGTVKIVKRHAATNLRCTVTMPREYADAAVQIVQRVLDEPVSWIATECPGYNGLNVFGIGSASMVYTNYGQAEMSITVKGLV